MIVSPVTPEDFEKYYRLRYEVLRQPWHQPRGSERVPDDDIATHAMLLNDTQQVIGVCRLHQVNATEAQIRFMAIRPDQQGLGLGNQLLDYFEFIARQWGVTQITLQAREKALNFYRRKGYVVVEKTNLLFGEIQHYKMVKSLT
jgi:predicted GNAT family N-acyltransferase